MPVRYFALIIGIVYLLVGIFGFIPGMVQPPAVTGPAQEVVVHQSHGQLFGLFPVNILHNIVHLVVGLAGIASYATFAAARYFSRTLAVVYGILTIMGLFPVLNTTFGLIPLHGHDIWLHAVTAIAAAYFGWAAYPREATYPGAPRRV